MRRLRPAAAPLLLAAVLGVVLVMLAVSSGENRNALQTATGSATPPASTKIALAAHIISQRCGGFTPQLGSDVQRVIEGRWHSDAQSGPEITVMRSGGAYTVTRCTDSGNLVVSQTDAPIPVPGGETAVLVVTEVRPAPGPLPPGAVAGVVSNSGVYPSQHDPKWAAVWAKHKAQLLSHVIPPTRPSS